MDRRWSTTVLPEAEVEQELIDILEDHFGKSPGTITMDTALDDIGMESLDLVEIALKLEARFPIPSLDEAVEKWRTVSDIRDSILGTTTPKQ